MNKGLTRVLAVGAFTFALAAQSNAVYLYYTEDRSYIPAVSGGGGYTYLDPDHVYRTLGTHSQAEDAEELFEAGWPSWNVSRSSTDAPGEIAVSAYEAWQEYSGGYVTTAGGHLQFDYISTDSSYANYRFVQIVYTNTPLGGATSPYIDPGVDPDSLPFYWDEGYNSSQRSGSHYTFIDYPSRSYNGSNAIGWAGALYLVEWTQPGGVNTLVIRDGVYWGWRTIGNGGNEFWGGGEDPSGDAVPEPGTLAALAVGIAAATRKRRSRT